MISGAGDTGLVNRIGGHLLPGCVALGCGAGVEIVCRYFKWGVPKELIEPIALAAILCVYIVWLAGRSLILRPIGRELRLWRTSSAGGDRIAIYVADLEGDNERRTARSSIVDSILKEIGRDTVEVLPVRLELALTEGANADRAADTALAKARSFLRQKNGDLLIWGRVHEIGHSNVLELRFVSADTVSVEGQRFSFNRELLLEGEFAPEVGAALAALAASLALRALNQSGTSIWKRLLPLADRLHRLVKNLNPKLRPEDRGLLLDSYGQISHIIGYQSGDPEKLRQAVTAFEAALLERTRERAPLDWATTQNTLGHALAVLAERGDDAAPHRAVAAFEVALLEWTRERVPLGWATAQNNLGNALMVLAERGDDAALRRAVAAYEAALLEWTRERAPLGWATAQNNLGSALQTLGDRGDLAAARRAVAAYEAALLERTRERAPLDWAVTQNNLGNALKTLGDRGDLAALRRAVAAHETAMLERTRERAPLGWATPQNNLGNALRALGERGDEAALHRAVAAYEAALDVLSRHDAPAFVALVERNLARARGAVAA